MPPGLYGVVFMNSACGTINSDGLPFPQMDGDGPLYEEFGSPLINANGLILRIDFGEQVGELTYWLRC